jgi:hypothetical protein
LKVHLHWQLPLYDDKTSNSLLKMQPRQQPRLITHEDRNGTRRAGLAYRAWVLLVVAQP